MRLSLQVSDYGSSVVKSLRILLVIALTISLGSVDISGQNYGILKKIFDPDGAEGDHYGWSVAVSDSVAVVGAPLDGEGSAHVYFRNQGGTDNWGFVARLTAPNLNGDDMFGWSVAVDDTIIVVGAPEFDAGGSNSGAAYVFTKNTGGANNWGLVTQLAPTGVGSQDFFGTSVAVSGDVIAVGAPQNTEGTVHIFNKDQGGLNNWGQVLVKQGAASGDEFGFSIDIRDTILVVGAPGDDSNLGSANVFYRDNDLWTLKQTLIPSDGAPLDRFGTSVAVDSITVVVGSPFDDDEGTDSGSAYIYQKDEGGVDNWGELPVKLVGSSTAADDQFGFSVSISQDVILVGAPQDDDSGASSGTSFLFRQDQGGLNNWGETQRIQAFDAVSGDQYGYAVDIEGPFLYVGAPTDDDSGIESGSVYIYREAAIICPDTPTLDCQDVTVYLDASGVAEINPDAINAGASASCEFNVTLSQNLFSCDDIGITQVTLTLVDLIGNQVECVANVTVLDTISPVFINCPPDTLTVSNNAGVCEGNVIWSIPVAQDNCLIDSIVQIAGPAPGTSIPLGIYDIQYVAYDPQLLTDTCTFVLEIVDTQAPFLACGPDLAFNADVDECNWTSAVGQLDPLIAIDNCAPVLGYEITTSTGGVSADSGAVGVFDFPVGVNTVCYMLTDSSGTQSDTCCFTVTVSDTQAPSVSCPGDIDVDTDPGVCQAEVSWTVPVPSDNCAVDQMTVGIMFADGTSAGAVVAPGEYGMMTMAIFPVGISSVVYTVTDTSGNMDACFFDVTVSDNEDPLLTCPVDITINTSDGGTGDCAGSLTFTHPEPTDNCEIASFTLQILNPNGAVEGPYEVVANAMQTRDFDLGVSTISYIAVDASGNSVSCNYNVTVVDDEDPAFITCPPDTLTIGTDVDLCGAFVNWPTPIADDNCGVESVVQIAGPMQGDSLAPGFYTITYVASDAATPANTDTCTFVLNVVDTQAPLILCPSNDVVVSTDPGSCTWLPPVGSLTPLVAIANCPVEITWAVFKDDTLQATGFDDVSGQHMFNLGTSLVCYYITETEDPDGNGLLTDTCCFLVVVQDNEDPMITCPADVTFLDDDDTAENCQHTVSNTTLDATASDNCAVVSITHDYPNASNTTLNGAVFPVGITIVTWTAIDTAGNIETCSFVVTVLDNINPFIDCPANVDIVTSDGGVGDCLGEYNWTHPTPTDNCEVTQYNYTITNVDGTQSGPFDLVPLLNPNAPGALFNASFDFQLGVSTVAYFAADAAGNTFDCSFTVSVTDDEDPLFVNCPVDTITIGTDVDNCSSFVNWSIPIAEDNCEVTVTQIAGPSPGDELAPGFYTITYLAEDGAMPPNTDTCTFVINIVDTQEPLILCPSNDVVVSADAGTCTWLPPAGSLTPTIAIANCPYEVTWAVFKDDTLQATGFDDVSGQHVFNLDTSIVCYYITETEDLDGNGILTDTCCFMVIVQDNELPVVTCPGDVTFLDDDDSVEDCQHTVSNTDLDATATDNCAVVSLTHDYASVSTTTLNGAVFPVGITIVTWTAIDTAGNIETCSFVVTVLDNINPFIDCPANVDIVTSDGGAGDCLGEYNWTHPTPTDNCEVTQYNYTITNVDGTQSGPFDLVPLLNPNAPGALFSASFDFQLGTSTVAYFAADAAGNTFDCAFTVSVTDDENPQFVNCPEADTLTIGTDVDNCSAFVNWSIPIAEDNCEVTVTQIDGPSPGDELAPGFYTITYLAEDGAMPPNTDTCTFVINVVDTQEPLILCPSNDVVVSTDGGTCTWFPPAGSLTPTIAIANCPYEVTWAVFKDDTLQATGFDDVSGQHVFNLDTSIVCYYITETEDLDGNGILTDTCCFMVIVQDNELPVVTCPGDVTFLDDDDSVEDCQHTVSNTDLDATATDNCAVVSLTHDYPSVSTTTLNGAVFPVGITIVTWTAIDTAGNIETCSFVVIVLDNINPFIDCPANVDIVTSDGGVGDCLGEYNWTHPTPTDNCAVTQYNYTITNVDGTQSGPFDLVPLLNPNAPGALFNASFDFQLGVSTVAYFAADAAGNTFDCAFTVSVTDDENPQFVNCPVADTLTIGTDVDNCSAFVNWSIPIAEDNCEVTVTQIAGPSPGDELAPGFYTITYLAEDGAMPANTDTCTFVINVVDTQEPLILCPSNDVVVSTDPGTCTWLPPAGSLTPLIAIANCPYEVTWAVFKDDTLQATGFDDVSGQHVFNLDTSIVCYYITETEDLDGNGILTDTCCFMVIVQDNELPVVTCPGDVTFLDDDDVVEDCQHTVSNTDLDASATDNCAVVSLTHDYPNASNTTLNGAVFPVGITIVTWTAIDTAGNIETCSFVVTVLDNINPFIDCPANVDIVTSDGGVGDCLGEYNWIHPTPTDNCAVTQYNYTITNSDGTQSGPFDLVPLLNPNAPGALFNASFDFQLGVSTVAYFAADAAGNTFDCAFTVSVTDDEDPQFVNCPEADTLTIGTDVDNCSSFVNWSIPIAEDNCEVTVTQITGPSPGDELAPGFYTITYLAEDGAMPPNTDTCEFVINVVDTQEPLILCPSNDVVVSADEGTCTWLPPAGSLSPLIAIANCPYEVTWAVFKDDTLQATGFDDVSGQHVFNLDTSIVCYYITETEDLDGNGILTDTCCFMVIVEDNELPMVSCPMDITFQDSGDEAEDCQHTVDNMALDATASDNCSVVSLTHDYASVSNTTLNGAIFPVGITLVTWTAVDTAGNIETCRFVVTVEDDINPEVICPEDAEITTSNNGTIGDCLGEYDWMHPVPTDNCAVTQYNYRIINGDSTISGPFDLVPLLNPNAPAELFEASYNFQLDTSIVEYYVEDAAGNIDTCTFIVVVTDDEAPMFVNCPQDTLSFGNEVDLCGAFANYAEPIAEDNCEVTVTQIAGPAPGDFVEPGFYIVIWIAVDPSGNSDTCEFVLRIIDTQLPDVECPSTDVVVGTDVGECTWTAPAGSLSPISAFDNCDFSVTWEKTNPDGSVDTGSDDVSGEVFDLDTTIVCYIITENEDPDLNGIQSDTCCFLVIVEDIELPMISCPDDAVFDDTADGVEDCAHTMGSTALDATASDNCAIVSLTHDYPNGDNTTLMGAVFPVGTSVITWTAIDTAGNSVMCSFTVTVNDNVVPAITCPPDTTIATTAGGQQECVGELEWLHPVPTDNCNIIEYTVTYTNPDGTTEGPVDLLNPPMPMGDRQFDVGVSTVSYFVEDSTGNTNACSFTVTVQDSEIPIFVNCPDTIFVSNDPSLCGALVNWPEPVAVDNCNDTLNVVQISGPASGSFIAVNDPTDITYQATDDSGNSVLCTFTVVVEDNEIPQAICQDTVVYLDGAGTVTISASDVDGGSFDNCGVEDVSVSVTDFTCADIGENNVLLTVTDEFGNADICVAEVTVLDTIAPTFECPPDSMVSVCEMIVPDFITGLTGDDNCSNVTFMQDPLPGVAFFVAVGDTFEVVVTAVDSSGNESSCIVNVVVFDEVCNPGCANDVEPPEWINCPRPPINVSTHVELCEAFVNFSLPVAEDNCELDTVVQIDNTGLTSGDMFPVGLTILKWIAVDVEGNISDTCRIKVFVNDVWPPQLLCPEDTTAINVLGGCGSEISGISPFILDNCLTAVTFKTVDTVKGFGIVTAGGDDASGGEFGCGTFEVTYRVSDQPILLISEVTHELEALNGGTNPVPPFIQTDNGDDFVEITNYGPTAMNISCLTVERIGGNNEVFVVPDGVILQIGDVLTLHYGDGTDDPVNFFYNVAGAADLSQVTGAGYVISIDTVALDVVAVNGFDPVGGATMSSVLQSDWSGSIDMSVGGSAYRQWAWDSNNEEDYAVADLCAPATIGSLNPDSDLLADIGITYSLQSLPPNTATCSFLVTIEDTELPQCGELETFTYMGQGGVIEPNSVFQTTINVPDAFEVSDVNVLNLIGSHPDMSQITFKLQSAEGANVLLMSGLCPNQPDFNVSLNSEDTSSINDAPCGPLGAGGTFSPQGDLNDMNGDMSNGTWTLTIANADPEISAILDGWTLELGDASPYSQTNVELDNDPGECGASFTWTHPIVLDNCGEGEIFVAYTTEDGIDVPSGGEIVGGSIATEFFEVGTTTITYTLSDKAGNTNTCSFDVTVVDTEIPVLVCPTDVVVSLGAGDCASVQNIIPQILGDNCTIDSFTIDPPSGANFDVGTTVVTIIAFDTNGNSDTCTFNVTVIGYIPTNNSIACNDTVNLSLGADCAFPIGADLILEGDDYGCYDDFCIVAVDENGDTIPDAVLTLEHVGQYVTVTVTDCQGTGLSCWGTLYVEDKLNPVVQCPPDITVACNESTDTGFTGYPEILSCETFVNITYDDDIIDNGDCGDPRVEIFRTWIATDESGNVGTCVQHIVVEPFDFEMIQFPPDFIYATELLCEDVLANPSLTEPSNTGWPTINGLPLFGDHFCEINVGYWDEFLWDVNCPGSYELLRHWIIRDFCEPLEEDTNPIRHIQSIYVRDGNAPEVNAWVNYDPSFGSSNNCTAFVLLGAGASDVCSGIGDIRWKALYTEGFSTQIVAAGTLPQNGSVTLPLGRTYTFVFTAEDECNNAGMDTVIVDLTDGQAPIAICDEHTIVSLIEDANLEYGLTKVPVWTFDDGSYDNCGQISLDARRMTSCINFDWTTNGAGIDDTPNGIINANDRGQSYAPMVPFACCDVGAGPIMVELRVTDEQGNINTCMVEVEVQDKLSPFVECVPEVVVSCDFWFAAEETNGFVDPSLDILTPVFGDILDAHDNDASDREEIEIDDPGRPTNPSDPDYLAQPYVWGLDGWADDNCDVDITVRVRIFDDCSGDNLPGSPPEYATRLVERTFRVRDGQDNTRTCVQRIWVVDFNPFYISDQTCVNSDPNDGVIWPCHQEYTSCPNGIPVDYPTLFDDNCSTVGVNYSDTRFDFVEGACYKILRQWEVIDWCQYNPQTGEGFWTYTQEIKVLDNEGPSVSNCPTEPVVLCVADSNVTLPENNQVFLGEGNPNATSCSVHVVLEHNITETCSDIVIYDVKVYPFNGSDFVQMVNTTEVVLDSNHQATLTFDSRSAADFDTRQNGLPYNDRNCLGIGGPKEYHRILWSIEDGCGNLTTCEYLFRLEDCKKPTPVCVGLSSVVMPSSGEVTIWATDFNASSFDDCTLAADLLYSFSGSNYEPSKTFDCAAIEANGSPSFIVEIWAADEGNDLDCNGTITWAERNKDFCTTFIIIDDNENVCPGDGSAGGAIETEELEPVENVLVNLIDGSGQIMSSFLTSDNGFYHFINPLLDYTITPRRNDDHGNGVSTLDLIKIQKHLLGIQALGSPYKMIAADANNSESISAIDLVQIRKLLLGIVSEFPQNESWRFVDSDFAFPGDNEAWPFDEVIELSSGMSLDENFIAVKVGDVNGSVSANAQDIETRSTVGQLNFMVNDRKVLAGEVVEVHVKADQFRDVIGYQFTLGTGSSLEFKGISSGVLDVSEEQVGIHKQAITMSWHETQPVNVAEDETLFTLIFTANETIQLSSELSMTSRITRAEAYNSAEQFLQTALSFNSEPVQGAEFALFQNEPNPFIGTTKIGFTLPDATMATLTFTDITGRVLHVIDGEFDAGYNEISVNEKDLSMAGMLYYKLQAGDFSATKKMILTR